MRPRSSAATASGEVSRPDLSSGRLHAVGGRAEQRPRDSGPGPIPGAAADPGESEPAVQRRDARIVDVDVEGDARLAGGAHAVHRLADQPGADVLAPGLAPGGQVRPATATTARQ